MTLLDVSILEVSKMSESYGPSFLGLLKCAMLRGGGGSDNATVNPVDSAQSIEPVARIGCSDKVRATSVEPTAMQTGLADNCAKY